MAKSRKLSRKGSRKGSRKASRKPHRKSTKKTLSRMAKRRQTDDQCAKYSRKRCGSVDPSCNWRKKTGCVRRSGVRKGSVYEGPSME